MWYEGLGVISIGAELGGPQDGGLSTIKAELWQFFRRHCQSTYCPTVDHYAFALRIDGQFRSFGEPGVERPRQSRKTRCIGSDIVVPESIWKNKTRNELRDYLARQIRTALEDCVARLKKEKEPVESDR